MAHLLKAFGALEEDVLRAYTRQVSLSSSPSPSLPRWFSERGNGCQVWSSSGQHAHAQRAVIALAYVGACGRYPPPALAT